MKNNFQSKSVPRGTRTIWRYLGALFLLFTFAIGNVWADCEKGTLLFSMEVTSTPSSKIQVSAKSGGVNGSLDLAANANVTVVGTSAVMYNSNSSAYDAITTAGEICFKSSSKHWIEISFPCALAAGDLITFTTTKTNPIAFSGTASGTKYSTTDNKLEISTSGTSELIGKTSLWIWRPGSEPNVKSLRIIRPATITLDAATNGGTVSVTSIKGATGDKVVLPHAFKSDYKFKGWYTAATEGTRRADYYTVSGDETVVAQFEALPSSGEMFSLEMQESMKPAADISLDKGKQRDLLEFAIISGGAAIGANTTSSSNHFKITSAGKISFNGTAAYMIINLDFPLAAGDVIATDVSAKTWVTHLSSAPSSGPYVDGTNKSYTIKSTDADLIGATTLYLWRGSNATLSTITITRPTPHTLSYAVDPTGKGTVTLGATSLIEGATTTATYSAIDAAYEFDEWQISGTGATLSDASGDHVTVTMGSTDATVTLKLKVAATKYTITYSKGAYGTGDAIPDGKKDEGVDFTLSSATYSRDGYVQTGWSETDGGAKAYDLGGTYSTDADEELFPFWTPVYTVTKGTHENGDFTISPASLVAGGTVTLDPTPNDGYMFSAWEIVKTSDASATGITVANKQFEMPAYDVTVNATFVTDTRKKVLYLTSASTSGDKLYAALKDDYKLTVAAPASQDLSDYDLVVLHESIDGKAAENGTSNTKQVIRDILTTTTPVLNTKTYFYNNSGTKRWDWGAPNAGQSVKGATQNSAYCNIASHPLFDGLTITDGFFEITDEAAAKCMQPVGSFTSGKEGYTLATTPNSGEGNGCAIHELTPAQRGATSGKYLMISVSSGKLGALNANGQKLFQNAAAYLVDGSASWAPISVPTAAEVTATPSENYTEGNTITLTASATGTTASTTYTWYKGADWATASATTPVQAAATDGNVFTKTAALEDAGTYWCNISNGTSCDVQASVTITVSSASTPTHAIIYDNTKGADMTAYPTEYTEGVGVASFAALADIAGWHFVEWSPASIAADATTDQTITAVWAQVFEVTFDLQGHGAAIAAQNIVSGGKVTKPDDPIAIGWDFGGWFTDAVCTAGNEWDFDNDVVSAATPLFAKWTEFDGCALLVPATSGAAPAVGDAIVMQTGSKGGSMSVVGTPLSYNDPYGLGFDSNASAKAKVTLNNEIQENTVITLTLVANGESARGLHIYSGDGATKITSLGWGSTIAKYTEATFTYTVQSTDVALIGSNEFQLWRNNSVWLKKLAVTACGDPVVFHNLTSAITPDHDPAYATVTLDASSVREGYTTKATYSAIDAGYEFDEWQISGTGASIADASANPAVITMGTTDAVITLKLKVATPKHTVTFNKMGKGDDVPSQLVAEGALVSEPSVAEPEGWMLEGWYKESTLENKWDFASDVMSTSDIELFANWVTDTSIKLINKSTGAINTTNFATAVAAEADVDGEKGASFSSARTAVTSISALGEMVQYNATTNQTKIQLSMYNTSTNQKTIYLFKVAEGDDAADVTEITIDGSSRKTTEYITFNSDKNRSFYVTVSDAKVKILQVKVVDDGTTPMKQFGQAGYSLNLNKGRVFAKNDGSAYPFEGGAIKVSSDYKVLNNSNLATKSYIQFNNAVANTILKVTRSGGNYYVSQDPEDKGTTYNKDEEIVLPAAGTWYLGSTSTGSSASFTKVEFLAPKCAEPAFNALANSDICSGDPYVALDGTGTVTDGGTITYKWYAEGGTDVLGTAATYTPAADGKYYVVALHHVDGFTDNEATSDLVTVTTYASAEITTAPADVRQTVGENATLTVVATGKAPLSYQWYTCDENGDNAVLIAGAEEDTYTVNVTADFDQFYKVVVTSGCGEASAVAHVVEWRALPQLKVNASTTWDWVNAGENIKLTGSTAPKKNEECVMANVKVGSKMPTNDDTFNSQALLFYGENVRAVDGGRAYASVGYIKFTTTVAGKVTVEFSTNTDDKVRCVKINGVASETSDKKATVKTFSTVVPAGEVSLVGYEEETANAYIRISKIIFDATDVSDADYTRDVTEGRYGTICVPNGGIIVGADIFELAYYGATSQKFFFDEIASAEMEAGKPYLFFPHEGATQLGVYYTDSENKSGLTVNGFVGFIGADADAYTQVPANDNCYIISNNLYRQVQTGAEAYILSNRAYIDMTKVTNVEPAKAPGARRIGLGVQGKDQAQGFENIETGDAPMKVMINGTMYILRGEKVYDATGRLVK